MRLQQNTINQSGGSSNKTAKETQREDTNWQENLTNTLCEKARINRDCILGEYTRMTVEALDQYTQLTGKFPKKGEDGSLCFCFIRPKPSGHEILNHSPKGKQRWEDFDCLSIHKDDVKETVVYKDTFPAAMKEAMKIMQKWDCPIGIRPLEKKQNRNGE